MDDEDGTQLEQLDKSKDSSNGSFCESENLRKRLRTYSKWSPMDEGVTLAWKELSVFATTKSRGKTTCKRLINEVTGAVKAGSLVAIMGASGAGKSSLMSALAHRNPAGVSVTGEVLVNGRPLGDYMKHLSGFMHQEDVFIGSLTVYEHMYIMACLKLDRRISTRDKDRKILNLLRSLGLSKCAHSRIGGNGKAKSLSGGELKRLSFATELLTDPQILFCDEPTTGLDAYSAHKLVSMMSQMASAGKTILCTIHQPSSDIFAMFSQLILLADGRTAFIGSTANATEFFEQVGYKCPCTFNPSEYFIKALASTPGHEDSSKVSIKRICDLFAVSEYQKEVEVVVQYEFHMGRAVQDKVYKLRADFKEAFWWIKLYWLTYRWFLEILRNPAVQVARVLQKFAIGIVVGLCYFGTNSLTQTGIQSVQGALFILVSENTFPIMYSVLDDFPDKYPIFLREYKSGLYSLVTYYISRILAMVPILVAEPLVFVLIIYWFAGLRATAFAFLTTALAALLTMNVSTACGIFFSNAFISAPVAMTYLVPFDYTLLVTAGVFVQVSSLPLVFAWLKNFSWLFYAIESMSIAQWQGVQNISCDVSDASIPCYTEGSQVLQKFSFSESHLIRDLTAMAILCLMFYLLGFLCLWRRTKIKSS